MKITSIVLTIFGVLVIKLINAEARMFMVANPWVLEGMKLTNDQKGQPLKKAPNTDDLKIPLPVFPKGTGEFFSQMIVKLKWFLKQTKQNHSNNLSV